MTSSRPSLLSTSCPIRSCAPRPALHVAARASGHGVRVLFSAPAGHRSQRVRLSDHRGPGPTAPRRLLARRRDDGHDERRAASIDASLPPMNSTEADSRECQTVLEVVRRCILRQPSRVVLHGGRPPRRESPGPGLGGILARHDTAVKDQVGSVRAHDLCAPAPVLNVRFRPSS